MVKMNQPYLSVVIPAFNEEKRLLLTLTKVTNFLREKPWFSEVLIIDDGSQDQTFNAANEFSSQTSKDNPLIKIIKNSQNLGKGASVRHGVAKSEGEIVLFTDADNSTPIEELDKLLPHLEHFDIAIGSRHLKESSILVHQPWHRKLLGRMANLSIQLLLLPGISDTQCGFKLFKAPVAKELFAKSRLNRWGFDMEILFLARKGGIKIKEVPVAWINSPTSRVRPIKDAWRTFKELLEIKLNESKGLYA